MHERLIDKIKRLIFEKRLLRYKRIIKKYVQKYDKLQDQTLMAFTWEIDDVTTYNLIVERSYPDCHIFGTKVEYYD